MSEYLSKTDLHQLTGYARPLKQTAWLKASGIPHRVDGCRVIVAHSHVKDWLAGKSVTFGEINWSAVK
jgi:hypothetical protein